MINCNVFISRKCVIYANFVLIKLLSVYFKHDENVSIDVHAKQKSTIYTVLAHIYFYLF